MENLSARQLAEWQAYAELEPFGERRADYRAASIAYQVGILQQLVVSVAGGKRGKPPKFGDYLLEFDEPPERRQLSSAKQAALWDVTMKLAEIAERKRKKRNG